MINNIRNIKNISDIKNFKDNTSVDDHYDLLTASDSLGQGEGSGVKPQDALPPFRFMKVDLYDNSSLQDEQRGKRVLNCNIAALPRNSTDYVYFAAGMNGNPRDAKRGMDLNNREDLEHWECVQNLRRELKQDSNFTDIRISKFYEKAKKGKGNSIIGLTMILATAPKHYVAIVVDGTEYYPIELSTSGVNSTQRNKNQIATGYIGDHATSTKKTRRDVWGI